MDRAPDATRWSEPLLLLSTLGVCFVSALVPLVNAEAYLGGVAALLNGTSIWALSAVASVGQMLGKLLWYQLGRSSLGWSWVRRRTSSAAWQARLGTWQRRSRGKPWLVGVLVFASAVSGVPPFAVISVLAGQLRVPVAVFLAAGLAGRLLRFAAVLGGVGFLVDHGVFS
jgi:membrane protein YqaA with SNARE-associated domain